MKKIIILILCFLNIVAFGNESKIIFRHETKEEAFSFLLYLMKKGTWFKENGYIIRLPSHQAFTTRPLDTNFNEIELKDIFDNDIYHVNDYQKSLETFLQAEAKTKQAIEILSKLQSNWNFSLMEEYQVILTLYGPGGNYCINNANNKGYIKVLTKSEGEENCNRKRPIYEIIIHEMVHIGIEKNIVQKYRLTHWEKERIVDLICCNYLNDILPNYVMQNISDTNIDNYISKEIIETNLPLAIETFVSDVAR